MMMGVSVMRDAAGFGAHCFQGESLAHGIRQVNG